MQRKYTYRYDNNKLYFNEMTFTPKSGLFHDYNEKYEKYLTKMLKIK